jgi:transposase
MIILALDLGKFNTMCCFFDTQTRKHTFLNALTDRDYLHKVFQSCPIDLVVMEACGPSGWIHDLAVELGLKTLVCSTNEDAWKWANVKRKTDRDDALKLARMASMNELKAVHMPSQAHREFRSLVKYRKTLDYRINKIKCTIRAWFVNHGIGIERGEAAWHTGRERINLFRKPLAECSPDEFWKGELDLELTQLDTLTEQLDQVELKLNEIGKHDPRIARIKTIPGVGPRTAEILVACIDDPKRFNNGREVSAYFGLVPRQYQSGETDRNGRITRRGNPLARTILVECAWVSLRYNPWAKAIYQRISGQQKTRRKKAAVALARKLSVIAWALLRDERDWQPLRMIEVSESFGPMPAKLKETLQKMKPKENSDQRKKRLRKEAREAREARESQQAREVGESDEAREACVIRLIPSSETKSVPSAAESSTKKETAKSTGKKSKNTQSTKPNQTSSAADSRKFPLGKKPGRTPVTTPSGKKAKRTPPAPFVPTQPTPSQQQPARKFPPAPSGATVQTQVPARAQKKSTRKQTQQPGGARQPVSPAETCALAHR